jgi:hypothetical protein
MDLKPGERLFTGAIVSPQMAATYNAATDKIEAFKRAGLPVPENLLNGRHNLINSYATA